MISDKLLQSVFFFTDVDNSMNSTLLHSPRIGKRNPASNQSRGTRETDGGNNHNVFEGLSVAKIDSHRSVSQNAMTRFEKYQACMRLNSPRSISLANIIFLSIVKTAWLSIWMDCAS